MLFNSIIFGPVKSRRLGISLGVNLLPVDAKVCSFECIYCECGFNVAKKNIHIPTRGEVHSEMEKTLSEMYENGEHLDVITFAGNGEPTLHKDFEAIIDDTIALRNKYFPETKISVLSNSTEITKVSVLRALNKIDNNILKLDSAIQSTVEALDQPNSPQFTVEKLIENLKRFNGNLIIQTLFVRGEHNGKQIDNTAPDEIEAWLKALQEIKPKQVMIYSLARPTPAENLHKVSLEELNVIAEKAKNLGFDVLVS